MTSIKPTHKAIRAYYAAMRDFADQRVGHESALRAAFQTLLADTARAHGWTLVPELSEQRAGKTIRPDGTLRDANSLPRGYWEAKDSSDDLAREVSRKAAKGYPLTNTIFEDTLHAILYQGGQKAFAADLTNAQELADLLNYFFDYSEPHIQDFDRAVGEFKERVPELARGLAEKIKDAHQDNPRFIAAFGRFFELCQSSLNPNISQAAVDEMLVQHLLTERLMRRIFDNEEFTRRNAIAVEVEKVIAALVSKSFNRDEFLRSLDRFYLAIENAAHGLSDFADKQHFLNSIYERFFQGYSVKVADTHGIVYTPQPIVDFMCASVVEVLKEEFGKTLGDRDVNILDPCVGTGNFIVNLLRRIPKRDLPRMYREQLFANEVMLLPYYIAALNVEHAYYELTREYEPFEGLCFVDTLDLAEAEQPDFIAQLSERNAARVERQKKTPITVIIGNPPYNVGQLNENDNNKNRKYDVIDRRIRDTYTKDSTATNKNALSDAYVKFFRWATDRLGSRDGVVAFVSNNGFLRGIAFEGFRRHLEKDFDVIHHFDFKGNARTAGERRREEGGNIFHDMIRCGVGITILVRNRNQRKKKRRILYHVVADYWTAEQKAEHLRSFGHLGAVRWQRLIPDASNCWLVAKNGSQYASFLSVGGKITKSAEGADGEAIFKVYGRGVATCRDDVVYDFNRQALEGRVRQFIEDYNAEVDRYRRAPKETDVDGFVRYDKIKWSESLKANLVRGRYADFRDASIRDSLYRPFHKRVLFFDSILNERRYQFPIIFPTRESENSNKIITTSDIGYRATIFSSLITDHIPELHLCAASDSHQCFPFYVYDEDGSNRRENVTDWAVERFREFYGDAAISKWDIFYYVYGMLHHPSYRTKYADNLKRELPRIPFAPKDAARVSYDAGLKGPSNIAQGSALRKRSVITGEALKERSTNERPPEGGTTNGFWAFARAGRELARWHLDYERIEPYPLEYVTAEGVPLSYRVEDKMRLSKDKTALQVNPSLKLADIPPEAFSYRLGNRSALEWVIDQYRVKEDKRSGAASALTGIRSDPNRADDPEYIVRLVGQVIRVSLETVRIVAALPEEFGG